MRWSLVVTGAPRTKKNHGGVIKRGRRKVHVPSIPYQRWALTAKVVSAEAWGMPGCIPITGPVNCCALFYRDRAAGDAVGFYQGLADLLERRGVIRNDVLIVSWDGSRLCKDTARPRVEVLLELVS